MSSNTIKCPECGTQIEISEAFSHQIEEELKKSLLVENETKLKKEIDKAKKQAKDAFDTEVQDLQNQLKEHNEKLEKSKQKELELKKQAREIEEKQKEIDSEIETRVKEKENALKEELSKRINNEVSLKVSDLEEQLKEKDKKVEEAQKREMELRKATRELEEKKKDLEIEVQRKMDEERKAIEEKVTARVSEENQLKLKEKEKQIEGLRKSLEDARRKSEQGSMETQGEVLEIDLEEKLKTQFIQDNISPVPKGIKGADIIQEVRSDSLSNCGTIIWEAKNTKNWSAGWIQKLKDDQRAIGANIAIIVSVALPGEIKNFGIIDGVWVSNVESYLGLAMALREQLIQISFARNASEGQNEKMEMMYRYLSGDEFKQKVEAIVETFSTMHDQLNKERRAMEKLWKEREKQIQRISVNTAGMYGDIRGIIGTAISEIKALELDDVKMIEDEISNS